MFRRLDAIQADDSLLGEKGSCLIGNLSTALSDTHGAFRRRLAECFERNGRKFRPHLAAAGIGVCRAVRGRRGAGALIVADRRGLDHAHAATSSTGSDGHATSTTLEGPPEKTFR